MQRAVAAGAHVIMSSGGVSMGDRDLLKPLLERAATVHCGRVLMKPGKPLTFATMDVDQRRILFFGLPGAPSPDKPKNASLAGSLAAFLCMPISPPRCLSLQACLQL